MQQTVCDRCKRVLTNVEPAKIDLHWYKPIEDDGTYCEETVYYCKEIKENYDLCSKCTEDFMLWITGNTHEDTNQTI